MDDVLVGIAKLLLASLAFVLIGWLGARDKRVGGVLLTFPLLNGIAMLTGADPIGIAGTVYLVAVWNCILFLVAIHRYEWLPPLRVGWSEQTKIIAQSFFLLAVWSIGATALARFRDALSWPGWLLLGQFAFATLYIRHSWSGSWSRSAVTLSAMWLNRQRAILVACFALVFVVMSAMAYLEKDARWVGWASALPLPGIFALATLCNTQAKGDLRSLADTVLLGPLLVIPFNWLLARAIIYLRSGGASPIAEAGMVATFWLFAAALVFVLVPLFARRRDRQIAK